MTLWVILGLITAGVCWYNSHEVVTEQDQINIDESVAERHNTFLLERTESWWGKDESV